MADKIRAIVNDKEVMLTEEAFKIASKHYGAVRALPNRLPKPEKPKELVKPVELTDETPEDFAQTDEADKVVEKPVAKPKRSTPKKKTT